MMIIKLLPGLFLYFQVDTPMINVSEIKEFNEGLKYTESLRVSLYYLITALGVCILIILFMGRYIFKTIEERMKKQDEENTKLRSENATLKQMFNK
jgi:hypothetical protein